MKKIIASLLLFFVSATLYARDTNYSSVQECVSDVANHASKAIDQNQIDLSRWFYSFANESQTKIDYSKGTVTFYCGCHVLESNNSKLLWKKIQAKLDQQISQQNANLSSLYGNRSSLICKYSDVTHRIDIDSCQ